MDAEQTLLAMLLADSRFPAGAHAHSLGLEQAVAGDPELRRLLDEVQSRELDPLTAVREIMEKVFDVDDGHDPDAR